MTRRARILTLTLIAVAALALISARAAIRARHMHRAREAGVEAVDRADDLQRHFGVGEAVVVHQRRLVGADAPLPVARPGVPRGRNHRLVIGDATVLHNHPVPERAARRLDHADAPAPAEAYRRFVSSDGLTILVGRDGASNDRLTFRGRPTQRDWRRQLDPPAPADDH